MLHDSLANYFELNAMLAEHTNYSLTELESMTRWERTAYTQIAIAMDKKRKEQNERQRNG